MDERIDVIASGSLLGIEYGEVSSFPVGYTEQVTMHGLDFEEFLWANGITPAQINDLKKNLTSLKPVDEFLHETMIGLFKEHIVTGGMPACVKAFVETKNFAQVLKIQKAIISDYLDDIAKYAKHSEKAKARECFLSMPRQLAKEYKKFQYSVVEKKGTARKFEGSVRWLIDAGIAVPCYNLSILELPLEGNKIIDEFKMYMNDTGLLVAMLDEGTGADIIEGNLGIYKGAIFENIVADIFTKQNKRLYYYAKPSRFEIDFVSRQGKNLLPIEVKSSENTKAKSLKLIMNNHKIKKAIKLSTKNLGERDRVMSVPLYMAMFL
jgi:predicted AAA+ superfamily ATPase